MVLVVAKKDSAGKPRPKQNATENTRKKEKAQKLKIYPTSEELRGDSPSGLAANAPFRSALSLSFYPSLVSLFGGCLTATRSVALVWSSTRQSAI